MKKIVTLLANGFEEIEALTPIDYLRRAEAEVTVAATGTSSRTVEGSHAISVIADITLDDYLSSLKELPDAIVIPGGMPGAKNISECRAAMSFLSQMFQSGRLITAICASPAVVLGKTEILKNKKWTCYPGMEKELPVELRKNHQECPAVADGNLITGRGPGAAEQFSMEIVSALFGEEAKEKIMNASVQRKG